MSNRRASWEWRKAAGGWCADTDPSSHERLFHAYDINDNAACEPLLGLAATCEQPNEGSRFCPACMETVKAMPAGRPERIRTETAP